MNYEQECPGDIIITDADGNEIPPVCEIEYQKPLYIVFSGRQVVGE